MSNGQIIKGQDAQAAIQPKENRLEFLLKQPNIQERFNQMLGKKAAGFMSSIISAYKANKALSECEPMSVISSAAIAAQLDLPINNNLGFAYIIPYKGQAQFQMGYKGFVQLGMRSGQYKTMNVSEVYEGEIVSHNPFTGEMEFKVSEKRDKVVGYVFYFKLLNGFEKYFYMSKSEVEKHAKRYSKSYQKGEGKWVDLFDEMAKKTVTKLGLSKWGVLSIEMQQAIQSDDGVISEDGNVEYPDAPVVEVTAAQSTSSRLHQAIEPKSEEAMLAEAQRKLDEAKRTSQQPEITFGTPQGKE